MVNERRSFSRLTVRGALRVPEITVYFWIVKALSTALGEATSDWSVYTINPVVAVLLGFAAFVAAMALQFRMRRYNTWTYWLAVCMVGVFGTMAADVMHVALGVPYTVSSGFYAVVLFAVFFTWYRTERTLSIHAIDTPRREVFYWLAVVATFAMGTALGDLTAYTFHLGYLTSGLLFAVIIAIPALGFWLLRWNAVFSFWFAYVATRPLGASFADYMGKPRSVSGLGWGDGPVALVLALIILALVAFLAITHRDVQRPRHDGAMRPASHGPRHAATARPRSPEPWPDVQPDHARLRADRRQWDHYRPGPQGDYRPGPGGDYRARPAERDYPAGGWLDSE